MSEVVSFLYVMFGILGFLRGLYSRVLLEFITVEIDLYCHSTGNLITRPIKLCHISSWVCSSKKPVPIVSCDASKTSVEEKKEGKAFAILLHPAANQENDLLYIPQTENNKRDCETVKLLKALDPDKWLVNLYLRVQYELSIL